MNQKPATITPVKTIAIVSLAVIFLILAAALAYRFVGYMHYYNGRNARLQGNPQQAVAKLQKAVDYIPTDTRIWKELGEAAYEQAVSDPKNRDLQALEQSRAAFRQAADRNPLDAEAHYGLARAEAHLELSHPDRYHLLKENPYNALPHYQEAVRLRPHGILYRYEMAKYLYALGRIEPFWQALNQLVRSYPSIYNQLKKEDFWSSFVRDVVKEGLQQAIQDGTSPRQTHLALSAVLAEEQDWPSAITHLQKALTLNTMENRPSDHITLGRLLLSNRQREDAEQAFVKAVAMSNDRDRHLERIDRVYEKAGHNHERLGFLQKVKDRFPLGHAVDILTARALMDLGEFKEAQDQLDRINREKPRAEAYYWLYKIAEKQKDPDRMELAIQKATVYDPKKSRYHWLFSNILARNKRWDLAENEATLAIQYAHEPNPWHHNHRARIRWSRQDFEGALQDWQTAAELKPKEPRFHARMAETYLKLGNLPAAQTAYQNALTLAPDNTKYKKRLEQLQAGE